MFFPRCPTLPSVRFPLMDPPRSPTTATCLPRPTSTGNFAAGGGGALSSMLAFSSHFPQQHSLPRRLAHMFTTPVYYANGSPHLGHAYTTILADALCRWNRLCGVNSRLSTGLDEHGIKVSEMAKQQGYSEQEWVDLKAAEFQQLFLDLDVNYDVFVRTTSAQHIALVQSTFSRLVQQGDIYLGQYSGWYSVADETFVPESQVEEILPGEGGDNNKSGEVRVGKVKLTDRLVQWSTEENYMFKLSKYRKAAQAWAHINRVHPASRLNELMQGLQYEGDLSVSRPASRQHWGIPVPSHPEQLIYVWFDALLSYLTAAGYDDTATKGECRDLPIHWPATHVVGKDIMQFHAFYFPAFLIAAGFSTPKALIIHGHWTNKGTKMSKSLDNGVDPRVLLQQTSSDSVRYFLLFEGAITSNNNFDVHLFIDRVNADLCNSFGNLGNRALSPKLNPTNTWPEFRYTPEILGAAEEVIHHLLHLTDTVRRLFQSCDIASALRTIQAAVQKTNQFLQANEPWKLCKHERSSPIDAVPPVFVPSSSAVYTTKYAASEQHEQAEDILYISLECLRITSILLLPVIPHAASLMLDKLGVRMSERYVADAVVGYEYKTGLKTGPWSEAKAENKQEEQLSSEDGRRSEGERKGGILRAQEKSARGKGNTPIFERLTYFEL
eukprot:TRINITY_DN887_c3_g3_i2.p1 TRINITY_DN887_c3_g3~~TRINITY_DN887_c3_g3_i2.p1  ORF type:complete len:666 (-),score=66.74 TRINITY_DN887_c3_g3_i2:1398-3395(-)